MKDRKVDTAVEGYRLDDQVGYLLRLAYQRHAAIFQTNAILDVTPTQFAALMRLAEVGTCSQNRLGRLIAMDAATIKGVVERLLAKGLIALETDPEDRRRSLIRLSRNGEQAARDLMAMGHDISCKTLEPLAEEERVGLLAALRKLG
jgi:DNA-binding MarR family transcriptional regulator